MSLSTSGLEPGFIWNKPVVCVAYTPFVIAFDINLCADLLLYWILAVIQRNHSDLMFSFN